jgi:hypothetical protein
MGWFRTNIRIGSRLALFALAIQYLLTFSHVHLARVVTDPESSTSVVMTGAFDEALPTSPPQDHESNCTICLLIQIAGSMVRSSAPTLSAPETIAWVPPEAAFEVFAASRRLSFNARAPPLTSHREFTAMSPDRGEGRVACLDFLIAQAAWA